MDISQIRSVQFRLSDLGGWNSPPYEIDALITRLHDGLGAMGEVLLEARGECNTQLNSSGFTARSTQIAYNNAQPVQKGS